MRRSEGRGKVATFIFEGREERESNLWFTGRGKKKE